MPAGDQDMESEEFRIMDSGACGAFVHGLEDEFQEVRNASIGLLLLLYISLSSLQKVFFFTSVNITIIFIRFYL